MTKHAIKEIKDGSTEIMIIYISKMVVVKTPETIRMHKLNDFKKPTLITVDKNSNTIVFHQKRRSVLPALIIHLSETSFIDLLHSL